MKSLIRSLLAKFGYKLSKIELLNESLSWPFDVLSPPSFTRIVNQIGHYQDKISFWECYSYNESKDNFALAAPSAPKAFEILSRYSIADQNPYPNEPVEIEIIETPLSRIHYACGATLMKDWLNVDFDDRDTVEGISYERVNLVRKHPFKDETFCFAFAEDFLEHLTQADSIIFLAEAYRTLKKGGVLRLSFPGLEGVCAAHYPNFSLRQTYVGKAEAFSFWDHIHFYSKHELEYIATSIGFTNVKFAKYGSSEFEALKNIDTREAQINLNTFAELTK